MMGECGKAQCSRRIEQWLIGHTRELSAAGIDITAPRRSSHENGPGPRAAKAWGRLAGATDLVSGGRRVPVRQDRAAWAFRDYRA